MSTSVPSSSNGSSPDTTPATSQVSTSQAPPSAPRARSHSHRRRHRVYRPAKNSLYDLFYEHAGTSLFVRPICWTDLHAQILGARFQELPPCDTPQPVTLPGTPPSKGHMRPSQTIITLSDSLTQILLPDVVHPFVCSTAIKTVLMTLWPESFSKSQFLPELHLFFGGRVYRDSVRAQIMWNFPPSEEVKSSYSSFRTVTTRPADSFSHSTQQSTPQGPANLPMVCYLGKSQLASIRRNLFRIASGPGRGWNEPVWRLQQLRAKMLIPSNLDHDAHFVGIFLAMAQKHFYVPPVISTRRDSPMSTEEKIPPCPNFHDVTLRILTHDTDTSEFLVYTGYVTAKFLERFHDPFKAPTDAEGQTPGIRIEYTRVPIWPILGLRERLGKALGHDVVGQFDPEEIETWEVDLDKHDLHKRKREPLTEVINNSFSSDSEDEPTLTAKKRCLSEGTPVGVVN